MLRRLVHIPSLYLSRATGRPKCLPFNLTLSVTFKCNSRCLTCNIHHKTSAELTLEEWRQVFHSIGETPFWVTISGGEPFLRSDFRELVRSLYDICRPSIINIPTNGLLAQRIPQWMSDIAGGCSKAQIVVNLSVDELGHRHDEIRGVEGNFTRVMETFQGLKRLHLKNLTVGFHTVISRSNVPRIPEIYNYLIQLGPDSVVAEIAEEREELGTVGSEITPDQQAYARAVDSLMAAAKTAHLNQVGKITRAFRMEYHRVVKRMLKENRQVMPCYAGVASAHIAPDGHVWACCTRAESMGNLRVHQYDFRTVWFSKEAYHIRKRIRDRRCWCPLANVSYTNMLLHMRTLLRVGLNYAMDH